MHKILAAMMAWVCLAIAAYAQTPNFPQTLPSNTVVGRLGISAGPTEAIPFQSLASQLAPYLTNQTLLTKCNVVAQGAVYSAAGATNAAANTTIIQSVINTCGAIYVPGPQGGQTYDSNGEPTQCLNVNATLVWTATLAGGAVGDGPSVSCINSNNGASCVVSPHGVIKGFFANLTLRHSPSLSLTAHSTSSTGACGFDGGFLQSAGFIETYNLNVVYNYDNAILGHVAIGNWRGGWSGYASQNGFYWACSFSACTPQWNMVGGTLVNNNNNDGILIQCLSTVGGSIAPNDIANVNSVLNGNYTVEVDGTACSVANFRIHDSFLGEGATGHIRLNSAATNTYDIHDVLLESPGFACTSGSPNTNCGGNLTNSGCVSGVGIGISAVGTAPVEISHVISYGCGGLATNGIWLNGPTRWSIMNSEMVSYGGPGYRLTTGTGTFIGNKAVNNITNGGSAGVGVFVDSTVTLVTTEGNIITGNTTDVSASGAQFSGTTVTGASVSTGGSGCTNGAQSFVIAGGVGVVNLTASFSGTVTGNALSGTLTMTGGGNYNWTPKIGATAVGGSCSVAPTVNIRRNNTDLCTGNTTCFW